MEAGVLREVMVGVFVGGFTLLLGNHVVPHFHADYQRLRGNGTTDGPIERLDDSSRKALVGGAITLHNPPRGWRWVSQSSSEKWCRRVTATANADAATTACLVGVILLVLDAAIAV
jgi:hypothetical protein